MGGEDISKGAGLVLRLGYDGWAPEKITCVKKEPAAPAHAFSTPGAAAPPIGPLLTLSPPDQAAAWAARAGAGARQSSPHSPASSSLSGAHPASSTGGGKRDRDVVSEEAEAERTPFGGRASDEEEEGNTRKKLRLTKEQSAFLENMFKEHSTLNPKLKQALANKLNLRPRQVEVWFQNRRARTKLKQTEMDCELLRKCCESLTDENRRLQRELQELKALKLASPHYLKLPPPALTMCPACERIGPFTGNTASAAGAAGSAFPSGTAKTHFYSPIAAARPPPAAC